MKPRFALLLPAFCLGACTAETFPLSTTQVLFGGLVIEPQRLTFGELPIDCGTSARPLTLRNTGAAALTVTITDLEDGDAPDISIRDRQTVYAIDPGQEARLAVDFAPRSRGLQRATFTVREGGESTSVVVTGQGVDGALVEDEFVQEASEQVDVLFVIDSSCSMSEEQEALRENFDAFISGATRSGLDYQIAVVSTDVDDCPTPISDSRPPDMDQGKCGYFADGDAYEEQSNPDWRLISPEEQPSPRVAFAATSAQGILGSKDEKGIAAAHRALSAPLLEGWNRGFVRPGAHLAVVIVSDEDDESPASDDFYEAALMSLKTNLGADRFSASAIVAFDPAECGNRWALRGQRYIDFVDRAGGISTSICTNDWAATLEQLSFAVFGAQSRFFLSRPNLDGMDGVQLRVDGRPAAADSWRYNLAANSVDFTPDAVPSPGATISVRYTARCAP